MACECRPSGAYEVLLPSIPGAHAPGYCPTPLRGSGNAAVSAISVDQCPDSLPAELARTTPAVAAEPGHLPGGSD
jgi:hypothetical protein